MSKTRIICLVILLFFVFLSSQGYCCEQKYSIRELRPLGGEKSQAYAINNNGDVVGSADTPERQKACAWFDGVPTDLDPQNDRYSFATAINDNRRIPVNCSSGVLIAYVWENGVLSCLPTQYGPSPDARPSLSYGINNNGNIVGDLVFLGSNCRAYVFNTSGTAYSFIHWGEAPADSKAFDINNSGDVIGWEINVDDYGNQSTVTWLCRNDQFTELGFKNPKALNDLDQVVGYSDNQAILWENNEIIYLGTGAAFDINDEGVIVGTSDDRAVMWQDHILIDLNSCIEANSSWILSSAVSINNEGQIVGNGTLNDKERAFLLTPLRLNPGVEFPVEYASFGLFSDEGTGNYFYSITDTPGLAAAVGEGIYPNTEISLENPIYQEYLDSGKLTGDIWSFVNSDDPLADYFKWATATGVQEGEKLFYTALALENMGEIQHAIKAYYALIVHFPFTQAYNPFENIYWYPGIRAIDAITRLTMENPKIGYELVLAEVTVENGYDSDPADEIFIANPGAFIEYTLQDRIDRSVDRLTSSDVDVRGAGRVQVAKRSDDSWQLRVDGKPFQVQGITYSPTKVGMIADDQTTWQWLDTNDNGLIDAAQEAWVDVNHNNLRDFNEPEVGDFQLLKEMGCNTIRIYHYAGEDNKTYQPAEYNKPLLRQLYTQYRIMVMIGDFFGGYTIGSGASWEDGTDYTNPEQRAAMKEVVRQMVLDHKDEPYVLLWLLGNENNMAAEYNSINATRTNASVEPQAYAEFLNEVAQMIHEIDPNHPVAVGNQDLGLVEYYAQYAPEIDIIATNHYTDRNGVGVSYLREAQEKIDRPLIISEYGADAYHQDQGVNELEQKQHHYGGAKAIYYNSAATPGEGIVIGGIVFEWLDEWWKAQSEYDSPFEQQIAPQFYWGIMPDHFAHEEWFGICGQGDGINSPFLRETRQVYDFYKTMWQPPVVFNLLRV